jgi:cytochrome c biogenesis protein CcmG, thiol:disulfide interchange protein DsbE
MPTATARTPVRRSAPPPRRSKGVLIAGAVAVVVLGLIAFLATRGGGGDGGDNPAPDAAAEVGPVEVTGAPLPELADPARDPAVGQPAPTVSGASFNGTPVSVGGAGPEVVFFMAHWCPHCQKEVPLIVDWLDDKGMPDGVDLRAVSTGVNEVAPNYPPSSWLAEEDWPVRTLADDERSSAAAVFGLSGYPFFVAIDAEGRVAARASGELTVPQIEALVEAARGA